MKIIILILVLFLQGNPPHIPPGCNNPVPGIKNPNCPDEVPIDGGLGLLAVAGGIYATRKLKNKQTKHIQ